MVDVPSSSNLKTLLAKKADLPTGGTNGQVLTKNGATTAWTTPASSGGGTTTVSDATTTAKGIIQLAGHLAGTADSPKLQSLFTGSATFGSSSKIPQITRDAFGRVTNVTEVDAAIGTGGGISAKVDGSSVASLEFTTGVTASDVSALPLPSGTPTLGQVPVVSSIAPLALGWGSSSTSSGGSGSGGTAAFTTLVRPETYGAKNDGVFLTELVVTQGSANVSSSNAPFTSGDVGKLLVWRVGQGGYGSGKIASVQSSTQATLTAAAASSAQADSGPNGCGAVGTDNTAAFNTMFSALGSVQLAGGTWRHPFTPGYEVRLGRGSYLFGAPLNPLSLWNTTIRGEGPWATFLLIGAPGTLIQLDTFNKDTGYAFPGNVLNWRFIDFQVVNPCTANGSSGGNATTASARQTSGIQDNGNGSVLVENVFFWGLKYGYAAAYGGDFTRYMGCYHNNCDVGSYFGPGTQQLSIINCDWSQCREGLVLEGVQNWHAGNNCHWQDPIVSGVTIEGKPQGQKTRFGVASDVGGGAWYSGNMVIDGAPWFESNSGNNGQVCPRMIWVNGDGPYGPAFSGLVVRDALLISGGQQQSGGTVSFIELNSGQIDPQPVVIDALNIGGSFVNYVFNYTGGAGQAKPLIKNVRMDESKIQYTRNANGAKIIKADGSYHGFASY